MFQFFFNRARVVLFFFITLALYGLHTYLTLPRESNPDIKIPVITVSVSQPGLSSKDAQRLLTIPLETELKETKGLKALKAYAYEGGSTLILEFQAGQDSSGLMNDLRNRLDQVTLPQDAQRPLIHEQSFSDFPILCISLSGLPLSEVSRFARAFKTKIETNVEGILEVKVMGEVEQSIQVMLKPWKIQNIPFKDILRAIPQNNVPTYGGSLSYPHGKLSLTISGLIKHENDLWNFPITSQEGRTISLKDIATIRRVNENPVIATFDQDLPCVILAVTKRPGYPVLDIVQAIHKLGENFQKSCPKNLKISFSQDESTSIKDILLDLQNNIIAAILLVMGVVVHWLGGPLALLVGTSIPMSFFIGLWFLGTLDITLNIVVLFSLILSVGMLVDGAIIVVEFAQRQISEGRNIRESFFLAAQRMLWPVVTSTFTILVVFAPLLFWPGIVGEFMKFLPLTLIATLTASIAVSLIFIPCLGGEVLKPKNFRKVKHTTTGKLQLFYDRLLLKALEHPKKVLMIAFFCLGSSALLYAFQGHGVIFFPNIEPEQAIFKIYARENLSSYQKENLMFQAQKIVKESSQYEHILTHVRLGQMSFSREDEIGWLTVEMGPWQKRERASKILQASYEKIVQIPGIEVDLEKNQEGPSQGKPFQLEISGMYPEQLDKIASHLLAVAQKLPGLKNIKASSSVSQTVCEFIVDRDHAWKRGFSVADISQALQIITDGTKVGVYRPVDFHKEVDIKLQYPKSWRTLDQALLFQLYGTGGPVHLKDMVQTRWTKLLPLLRRFDGQSVVILEADIKDGYTLSQQVDAFQKQLKDIQIPDDVSLQFKGETQDVQETQGFLIKAFVSALLGVICILAIQFNSFFYTALILSSVFMATMGVLVGLVIMQQSFCIVMTGIGIIALAGIIVSNNIILIDTFQEFRSQGLSLQEAVYRSGQERLRPVILTKLTTILGLIPLVFGITLDFIHGSITLGAPATQWWVHLSSAIVFGVLFASPLTLFVTPCSLLLHGQRLEKKKGR